MSSTWGECIKLSIFGGSHTQAIGVNIDGLPAGEKINMDEVYLQMSRRAPGQDAAATTRKEADRPNILCGLSDEGILTGDPVCAVIQNNSQRSKDYSEIAVKPRPGHADYTAHVKYRGFNDIRGGGHFSGRLTAPLVFAGAVCRQILRRRGVEIGAHAASVKDVADRPFHPVDIRRETLVSLNNAYFPVLEQGVKEQMYACIEAARQRGDSVGGTIECAVIGLPVGLGAPMFEGVENRISSIVFGIPAVKGISFGDGFAAAAHYGSENNDSFYYDEAGEVCTRTNHAGGILGGITNGMPLVFQVAIKPTPSISQPQKTVNLETKANAELLIKGRHDPCILPRAIPVVEAAAAVAIMDLWMMNRGEQGA